MKRPWISDKIFKTSENGIITLDNMFNEWKYIVMLTDKFSGGIIKEGTLSGLSEALWQNLLELRVFDGKQELRIFRESVGDEFSTRLTDDSDISEADYFDETLLLNINRNKNKKPETADGGTVFSSISGGRYILPAGADAEFVKVRNYVSYDSVGTAVSADFRIVDFK